MGEIILKLEEIKKSFGETQVLKGIDLEIEKGEFITFLGSSGCGKTTTIRIIAGLEEPDSGHVWLNDREVTGLEPNKRDVNTVFQNYALFPHMDVFANVAYGLKLRKVPKEEIRERVMGLLELVQLEGYEHRMPSELSGGQKQRVAIARAVVNNPAVLLLDEPLGALDLQLRRQMQTELKRLQKQLGITFIYITHDQEEAINMSDRIVVMKDGRFEQIGTPEEIYDYPKTSYVAGFVGAANVMEGTVKSLDQSLALIEMPRGQVRVQTFPGQILEMGKKVSMAVHMEYLNLHREPGEFRIPVTVKEKSFAGGVLKIVVDAGSLGELVSSRQGINSDMRAGDQVYAWWEPKHGVLVDLKGFYQEPGGRESPDGGSVDLEAMK